ncbi:MAG: T9SS type A sorting domain-containing protein [Bacteroidia bacterium]
MKFTNAGTFDGIASFPVSGQVYTLTQTKTSIEEDYVKPYTFKSFNNSIEIESEQKYEFEVIDINGRAINASNYDLVASNSYDLSSLASGIYVVKISIGNTIYSEKITIL